MSARPGSIVVNFQVLVANVANAQNQVASLQAAATSGTLSLGGLNATAMTTALPLVALTNAVGPTVEAGGLPLSASTSTTGASVDDTRPPVASDTTATIVLDGKPDTDVGIVDVLVHRDATR